MPKPSPKQLDPATDAVLRRMLGQQCYALLAQASANGKLLLLAGVFDLKHPPQPNRKLPASPLPNGSNSYRIRRA